jgi:rhamnosyltransferase subunit B
MQFEAGARRPSMSLTLLPMTPETAFPSSLAQPSAATSPAHIVVATVGTSGDIHPFLGVATALQLRGHRVTFLAPAPHEHAVRQAGLPFEPLGTADEFQAVLDDPDLWDGRKAFGVIWRHLRGRLHMGSAFMDALPRSERCLLFVHPLLLPVVALARSRRPDVPIVGAYLAPSNLRTCHSPLTIGPLRIPAWMPMAWRRWLWARVDARFIDAVALPDLNAERHAAGLPPVDGFVAHMHAVPDVSVALFPEWFAATQPDWPRPMVRTGFPLVEPCADRPASAELDDFLAAGAAPIVFTAGTGHQHASRFFGQALDAVQRLGARAVFLTRHRAQLPADLPPQVLWQAYVPFHALLPKVAALVHHGGIGTTAEALRAGVPQLVVPFAHDQFDNGERVRTLGVGRVRPAAGVRAGAMAAALRGLAGSADVAKRCAAVAACFPQAERFDGLCGAIEALLERRPAEGEQTLR